MTASTGESGEREIALDLPNTEGRGDIPADTFALRLAMSRHHAGRLSIEKAAERCGLNPGNWAHWENGRRPLDKIEVAQAVADGLGMDFYWLMFGGQLTSVRTRRTKRVRRDTEEYRTLAFRPPDNRPPGRPIVRSADVVGASEVRHSRVIRDLFTEAPARCVKRGSQS
jgi:transcriptional regulator with XRE-family HTH domain